MADLDSIGKSALLAWLAASLVVWGRIAWTLVRTGNAPIPKVERQPVSWPGVPVCATFLAALLIPSFIVAYVQPERGSLAMIQWGAAARLIQIAATVGLLAIPGPLRKEDFGCDLSNWRGDVAVGLRGFLASAAPVFGVIYFVAFFGLRTPDDQHPLLKIVEARPTFEMLAWIVFSATVIAPLSEELTYRVLLQGWLQSELRPWQAIVVAAGTFAVAHEDFDRLPLLPLALILGYVYYRRHSYLSVVVLHGLFNGIMLAIKLLTQ